jgi:dienelactone hydrolase
MNREFVLDPENRKRAFIALIVCTVMLMSAVILASRTQQDFGRVAVTDVYYPNINGISLRAKLFLPVGASRENPLPGVVYIHGYQNNRETGDAYAIEIARRGIVVLNIDAVGRGHSGIPGDPKAVDFDSTYGGRASVQYIRSLPFVDPGRVGIMGHSLGAEMAYLVALVDPTLRALVLTGYAYTLEATPTMPKNMLMIIGKYDEFRKRMTMTRDIERQWMATERTRRVFGFDRPELGKTYGDFAAGTARRVFVPPITHVHESHHQGAIAETLVWFKAALTPPERYWIDPHQQIWPLKEFSTLVAMLAGFALLLPLGFLLLGTKAFRSLVENPADGYACSLRDYRKYVTINGVLLWLYLPLILVLFGIHKYLVRIDGVFPMMMVNAVVWWFLWVNIIGFFLFRRWFTRQAAPRGISLLDMGVSDQAGAFRLHAGKMGRAALLAVVLFACMYLAEFLAEKLFVVNFRFVWPFFNDLTPYRWQMFFLYLPWILLCFLLTGVFLHGQIRRPTRATPMRTFRSRSLDNVIALCVPLILFLLVQYVPLFVTGFIPFVGPNGLFVVFVINLFHILMLLAITAVISTWFYEWTGRIYLGAILNALLVTWSFAASQVIAPIPV